MPIFLKLKKIGPSVTFLPFRSNPIAENRVCTLAAGLPPGNRALRSVSSTRPGTIESIQFRCGYVGG